MPKTRVESVKEKSMGIESIKERINNQNLGSKASFTIETPNNKIGTIVKVCLPIF